MDIQQGIQDFLDRRKKETHQRDNSWEHHCDRSWEHCYQFFHGLKRSGDDSLRDAALHLGFYLASWGMYRGSSFLRRYAYTVHVRVVGALLDTSFAPLWESDIGTKAEHVSLVPAVLRAAEEVRKAYHPFGDATDTLVTKVLLGTLGCVPACDSYFIDGFRSAGFQYSQIGSALVDRLLQFCYDNADELQSAQLKTKEVTGVTYPFMKLVDMYFWQLGNNLNSKNVP